ncbi:hypothetical protein [Pseudomonas lini]
MKALRVDPVGRRLRAKALFHSAAQCASCPHTPHSMANWWQQSGLGRGLDARPMWRRAFHGATLVSVSREKLYLKFPALRRVFDNPLWAMLANLDAVGQWDELAGTIRVGNQPLDSFHGKLTTLLFDRVDWSCFAVHWVLFHTRHPRFLLHRKWLARNLTAMYALTSVQSPIIHIREEMYRTLSLNMSDLAWPCEPVNRWSEWALMHGAMANLLEQTRELHWINSCDEHLALLIWNLEDELLGYLAELALDECCLSRRSFLPPVLRRKWARKISEWHDHPVSLNGYCCD